MRQAQEPLETGRDGYQTRATRTRRKYPAPTVALNPLTDDVVKIVKDMTDGYGCDVYIEATGHPNAVVQGLQMIRKLGRLLN